MSSYSKDEEAVKESLMNRTKNLLGKLNTRTRIRSNVIGDHNYDINLQDLQEQYPIRDKVLLIKSCVILLLVISVFFLHSLPQMSKLGLGWTALLGALLLLLLSGRDDVEAVLARVEWSTLLFFASLFILMEVWIIFFKYLNSFTVFLGSFQVRSDRLDRNANAEHHNVS